MLLIGSRVLNHHIPEFRQPKDWDLVGNETDRARLLELLPHHPGHKDTVVKSHFLYDEQPLEIVLVEHTPYWKPMFDAFQNEPRVTYPILGEVILPPASFVMLCKHACLVYPTVHWHKHMRDFYLLKSYLPEIPEYVAELFEMTQQSAADMYRIPHEQISRVPVACHPKVPPHPRQDLHALLHDCAKLGPEPLANRPGAWQAFPDEEGPRKEQLMTQLLAEEAMVLSGHRYLNCDIAARPPEAGDLMRYSLRMLMTAGLPEGWRYFGVNHYNEIAALIPKNFTERFARLDKYRPNVPSRCDSAAPDSGPTEDDLANAF